MSALAKAEQQGFDDALANAVAMARLCALAGVPERIGEFIAARKSLVEVRAILEAEAVPPVGSYSNGAAT